MVPASRWCTHSITQLCRIKPASYLERSANIAPSRFTTSVSFSSDSRQVIVAGCRITAQTSRKGRAMHPPPLAVAFPETSPFSSIWATPGFGEIPLESRAQKFLCVPRGRETNGVEIGWPQPASIPRAGAKILRSAKMPKWNLSRSFFLVPTAGSRFRSCWIPPDPVSPSWKIARSVAIRFRLKLDLMGKS